MLAIAEKRGFHDRAITGGLSKIPSLWGAETPSLLWQAYAGLANVYSIIGDFPKADANYSKALQVICFQPRQPAQSQTTKLLFFLISFASIRTTSPFSSNMATPPAPSK